MKTVRLAFVLYVLIPIACLATSGSHRSASSLPVSLYIASSPVFVEAQPFELPLLQGSAIVGLAPWYIWDGVDAIITRGGDFGIGNYDEHWFMAIPAASGYSVLSDAVFVGLLREVDQNGFPLMLFEVPCSAATWPCGY